MIMYARRTCPLLAVALLCGAVLPAAGQETDMVDTSFTYQGFLSDAGYPVNDQATLQFWLYDADVDGTRVGPTIAAESVDVVDGLFTVELDFGAAAFNGGNRWLEIAVAVPAGSGTLTTLSPRQPLRATPFALQTRGLAVDDDGYVGIGTTAPAHLLEVAGDSGLDGTVHLKDPAGAAANMQFDLTGGYEIFRDDDGAGADDTRLWFDTPDEGELVLGPRTGADYLGNMRVRSNAVSFETADGGWRTLTIATGKVGIGTANPGSVISNSKLDIENGHIGLSNNFGIFSFNSAGTNPGAGFDTTPQDDLQLWAGSGDRVTVTADGDVGIGTASPEAPLHVVSDAFPTAQITQTDNTDWARLMLDANGSKFQLNVGAPGSSLPDTFNIYRAGVGNILSIPPDGNVGIGTTNPQAKLHVHGDLTISGSSGDGAVDLPTGSVSADETADEPGLATDIIEGGIILDEDAQPVAQRTITCPSDGYVVVTATLEFRNPDFNPAHTISFGISTSASSFSHVVQIWQDKLPATSTVLHVNPPRTINAVYPVTGGSHTFYLLARRTGSGFPEAHDRHLIVMFFPSAYGTVEGEIE
jgi:hypothetical protein